MKLYGGPAIAATPMVGTPLSRAPSTTPAPSPTSAASPEGQYLLNPRARHVDGFNIETEIAPDMRVAANLDRGKRDID